MSAYKPITKHPSITKRPLRAIANRASYGVYDTDGMRICTINNALTSQAEYAALLAAAPYLYEELLQLVNMLANENASDECLYHAKCALSIAAGEE